MAYFARVNEDNIVEEVLSVPNDQEHRGSEFLADDLGLGGNWIKTSYNSRAGVHYLPDSEMPSGEPHLRYNYAGVGYTYDPVRDAFIPPKRFDSWVLDENTCNWVAPIPYPEEPGFWRWNEETVSWELHDITEPF